MNVYPKYLKEGDDGWFISLSKERWNGEELAEPLELLDGVIVDKFERRELDGSSY